MNEQDQSHLEYLTAIIFFIIPVGLLMNSIVLKFCLWILNLHP
jgi:hypothetical protein